LLKLILIADHDRSSIRWTQRSIGLLSCILKQIKSDLSQKNNI